MKKLFFLPITFCVLLITACNNNEAESEPMVRDSMGVTTAPITDHVDSLIADSVLKAAAAQAADLPAAAPNTTPGVQTITENFVSADGQSLKAVYNNNGQMAVVTLSVGGEDIKLMQTEASANSATYSNGNITWKTEGSSATLTKGGKETKFNLKR